MLPCAAEFEDQAATGFERAGHGGGGSFGRLDPMQHGIREDGVEFGVDRAGRRCRGFRTRVREVLTGLGDHGGGTIDAEHLGAGLGDLGGEVTGAAADIEDALAGLGGEQRQKVAAEFPDEGVGGIVESGIPVRLHVLIVFNRKTVAFHDRGVGFASSVPKRLILWGQVAILNTALSDFSTSLGMR